MTRPSYQNYGTYDESAHPDLWDGVVGYWAPCLGPTGTRLHDASRFNNWGTLTNMDAATDWVIDGGQYALDFDGSNDTVIVSNTPLTGTSTYSYTISLWFRSNSNAQSAVLIGSGAPWYLAQGFAGANTTGIGFFNGSSNPGATNFINTSRWQMITVSKSGGNLSMYYDGSITYGPAADNNALSTAGFRFGGLAGGFNWSGVIGSCSFHSRGLTAREVAILYNLGPGGMLERRRRRRVYSVQADVVRSYLFTNRGQVIGGGTL